MGRVKPLLTSPKGEMQLVDNQDEYKPTCCVLLWIQSLLFFRSLKLLIINICTNRLVVFCCVLLCFACLFGRQVVIFGTWHLYFLNLLIINVSE